MTSRALILNRSTNSARYTAPEIADLSLNNSKSPMYTSSSLESVNSSTNLWIGLSRYVGSFTLLPVFERVGSDMSSLTLRTRLSSLAIVPTTFASLQ